MDPPRWDDRILDRRGSDVSRWDSMVSSGAWDDLAEQYEEAGGEDADDHTLAEILRRKMTEVEG